MRRKTTVKFVTYLIFISLLINISVLANSKEDIHNEHETANKLSFSLMAAINYAIENSPMIGIVESGLEKAEVNLSEAEYSQYNANKITVSTFDLLQVKRGYFTRMAKMGVELSIKSKEQTIEGIKFGVEASYFNLLNSQDNLKINKDILKATKENLEYANEKYKAGAISLIELIRAENALAQVEYELKVSERDLDYKAMEFNKTLGLSLDTEVVLTDSLEIEIPTDISPNKGIEKAFEERYELIAAKEQVEVSKLSLDIVSSYYTPNTYKYQQAKYDYELDKYLFENTKQDVELSVRKAYMDMLNAHESIDILDKSIEQIEKVYEITRTKFDAGMATNNDLIEALNQLKEFRLNRARAILAYNLAKKQYDISCGIGLPGLLAGK